MFSEYSVNSLDCTIISSSQSSEDLDGHHPFSTWYTSYFVTQAEGTATATCKLQLQSEFKTIRFRHKYYWGCRRTMSQPENRQKESILLSWVFVLCRLLKDNIRPTHNGEGKITFFTDSNADLWNYPWTMIFQIFRHLFLLPG